MADSQVFVGLRSRGKGYYGDPCYDSQFGSTWDECSDKTTGASLAHMVFDKYGIGISSDWDMGSNAIKYGKCCPLDILNQDPFACIKMSLMSSLLDQEYWEVYADENGEARFIRVLPEGGDLATLPRVQYCLPTLQPADNSNLVVLRSADPPPFRRCKGEWYEILDGTHLKGVRNWEDSLFPDGGRSDSAKGVAFSWGEITGMGPSKTTDYTCELGKFNQFGSIIYPYYERKQIYSDGVDDGPFEIEGFEQVLFWLVEIDYDSTKEELAHYTIQFVKSSEAPVYMAMPTAAGGTAGDTYHGHLLDFGPVCDLSETGKGTGTEPHIWMSCQSADFGDDLDTCANVQVALQAAQQRKDYGDSCQVHWDDYAVPSFYGYGYTKSLMNFNDYSRWGIGTDECLDDNVIDNIYESTVSLMGNGCQLSHWSYMYLGSGANVAFGVQQGYRTIELPHGSVWIESTPKSGDEGRLIYSLRAEAPYKASIKVYTEDWKNPYHNFMMRYVSCGLASLPSLSFQCQAGSAFQFDYPGYLFGWDDGLYTISEMWAKVRIARPGIAIEGFGRGVDLFIPKIKMRVMPVYQVDFPSAVAAEGENYDLQCVDVYKDLRDANSAYCDPIPGQSEMEKLQEAMSGSVLDITLPFLFPDFRESGQNTPSQVNTKDAFDKLCQKLNPAVHFLWTYIKRFIDEPNKGFTYVCGPPKTDQEVPKLGQIIETEAGNRTINSINYNYSDGSAFTVNIEAGPVSLTASHAGSITKKRTRTLELKGKIVNQGKGALYKVDVPGIGVIQAWNIDKYPWDVGDKVDVTVYNHPLEI